MKKIALSLSVLAVASLMFAGCKKDPVDRMLAHTEAMLKILEDNKAEPAKAGDLLEKYVADNKADIEAINAEMEKLSEEEQMKMAMKALEKAGPIMEKSMKLMMDPKIMGNEKIQKAMGALSMGGGGAKAPAPEKKEEAK